MEKPIWMSESQWRGLVAQPNFLALSADNQAKVVNLFCATSTALPIVRENLARGDRVAVTGDSTGKVDKVIKV